MNYCQLLNRLNVYGTYVTLIKIHLLHSWIFLSKTIRSKTSLKRHLLIYVYTNFMSFVLHGKYLIYKSFLLFHATEAKNYPKNSGKRGTKVQLLNNFHRFSSVKIMVPLTINFHEILYLSCFYKMFVTFINADVQMDIFQKWSNHVHGIPTQMER